MGLRCDVYYVGTGKTARAQPTLLGLVWSVACGALPGALILAATTTTAAAAVTTAAQSLRAQTSITFPGLRMLCGSSARLMVRIISTAPAPYCCSRYPFLPMP